MKLRLLRRQSVNEYSSRTCSIGRPAGGTLCPRPITLNSATCEMCSMNLRGDIHVCKLFDISAARFTDNSCCPLYMVSYNTYISDLPLACVKLTCCAFFMHIWVLVGRLSCTSSCCAHVAWRMSSSLRHTLHTTTLCCCYLSPDDAKLSLRHTLHTDDDTSNNNPPIYFHIHSSGE